ncbi:hypothetical protein [Microbacterium psychrotolerans]|uniref:hypothetical protein n=1 Tax=Microbacterium psychrotolerans TaxID=3068321 RepID=UPI003AAD0500
MTRQTITAWRNRYTAGGVEGLRPHTFKSRVANPVNRAWPSRAAAALYGVFERPGSRRIASDRAAMSGT